MTERFARGLAELAELCMVSARDLVAAQVAATDPAEKAACASALHKVGRSLRQCMALEAKLRRDQNQGVRDAETRAAQAEQQRRKRRRETVEKIVGNMIWDEAEDDGHDLVERLEAVLDMDMERATFGEEPLEAQIAHLRDRLGLGTQSSPSGEVSAKLTEGVAPRQPDGVLAPPRDDADDAYWRSSA